MAQEAFKQLRQSKIQLSTRLKLKNIFSGEWESIYKGEGIEFADIQPYEPGDDLRDLDLVTLVKSGEEEIVQRTVGRQMKIFIWADLSGSMKRTQDMFFSSKPDIRDITIGLIIYSARNVYSPAGLCAFDNEIKFFVLAKYGEDHCDRILDRVLEQDYKGAPVPADIMKSLNYLIENVYKQSIVFYVSDFKDAVFEEDFTDLLKPVAKKFDFIPVVIRDPIEKNAVLKRPLNITVRDNEGDRRTEIYLTPEKLRELQRASAKHLWHLDSNFRQVGLDYVVLDSPSIDDCYHVLSRFFEGRNRIRV